jgi:hypothetical protein
MLQLKSEEIIYWEGDIFCNIGDTITFLPDGTTLVNMNNKVVASGCKEFYDDVLNSLKSYNESPVNNPKHYNWLWEKCGIQPIDVVRHMDFDLGNALKYIVRAGKKKDASMSDKEKTKEDLEKAIYYINDYINNFCK